MAKPPKKRDPAKTARNKMIVAMTKQLQDLLPSVLAQTKFPHLQSLNATIGHRTDEFIDLKNEIINNPEHYTLLWMDGFDKARSKGVFPNSHDQLFDTIKASPALQEYLDTFLRRSYLKHYDELHKRRPTVDEAEIWIGQNHADYGLLVSPRFVNGAWENDKSEIRNFKPKYWTIGHVLKTGLVVPDKDKKITFTTANDYLNFFEHSLVRGTASPHQRAIAELYVDYVKASDSPNDIPLLLPELRYDGKLPKHKYRLDFSVINPATMDKVGFELSPWSTHGKLTGVKLKTQKEVNDEASANFDKEMTKHKDFFRKHGVFALIYTDVDLKSPDDIFADIERYLSKKSSVKQLSFKFVKDYFK